MAAPLVSNPGRNERIAFMGQVSFVRARGEDTGGLFSMTETRTPAGSGPPPHVHEREDEMFFVLEGEFSVTIGGETSVAGPGTFVFAPRDIPHAYVANAPSRHLTFVSPPGFERFLADAGEAAIAGPQAVAAVAARYGVTMIGNSGEEGPG
jgi:quercetin dioxygenase-like cupin family protein